MMHPNEYVVGTDLGNHVAYPSGLRRAQTSIAMESIGVLRRVDGASRCVYDEVSCAGIHKQEGPATGLP